MAGDHSAETNGGVVTMIPDKENHWCDFEILESSFPSGPTDRPYFSEEAYVVIRQGLVACRVNYMVFDLDTDVLRRDEFRNTVWIRVMAKK